MALDLEQMKKDQAAADAASSGFEKVKYMTMKHGLNKVRILPPKEPRATPYLKVNAAWVGPNNRKVIVPPNSEWSEDCPLRKEIERLMASGDDADRKLAGKMQPRERFCYFVLDRAEEHEGPKLMELTSRNFTLVNAYFMNEEYGDISDPATGVDGNINYTPGNKTANGFPDFQFFPSRHSTPLAENPEQYASLLEKDWFEYYGVGQISDQDYIAAVLAGTEAAYIESKRKPEGGAAGEVKHPYPPMEKFWIVVNGQSQESTAIDIAASVSAGYDPQICHQANPAEGWKLASQAGFVKVQPVAPPQTAPQAPAGPPAAPPALPAPPTPSAPTTPADAAQALTAGMREAAEAAPWEPAQPDTSDMPMPAAPSTPPSIPAPSAASSQVLQDLKSKLG